MARAARWSAHSPEADASVWPGRPDWHGLAVSVWDAGGFPLCGVQDCQGHCVIHFVVDVLPVALSGYYAQTASLV